MTQLLGLDEVCVGGAVSDDVRKDAAAAAAARNRSHDQSPPGQTTEELIYTLM